jgi:hypothetical protein
MSLLCKSICTLTLCSLLSGCGQSGSDTNVVRIQSNEPPVTVKVRSTGEQPSVVMTNERGSQAVTAAAPKTSAPQGVDSDIHPECFLTDSDVFAVIVHPTQLAESQVLGPVFEQFYVADHVGVASSEMDWVCVAGTDAAFEPGHEMENITIAARTMAAIDADEILSSKFPTAHTEQVDLDGLKYTRLTGITNQSLEMTVDDQGRSSAVNRIHSVPPMALYQQDANTFVVCAESRLKDVLNDQTGQNICRLLDASDLQAPLVFAAVKSHNDIDLPASLKMFVPKLDDLMKYAEAISGRFQPDGSEILTARVYVQKDHSIDSLTSAATECHANVCDRVAGFGALASPELKPVLEGLHELLNAADIDRQRDSVRLTFTSQAALAKVCEGLRALVPQTVAAR